MLNRKFCCRYTLATALFLAVVAFARPALADEIWVAPTLQQDLGGLGAANVGWPVTPIGAVRLALAVPDNLQQFSSARLVMIPKEAAGSSNVIVWACAAQPGDVAVSSCAGPTAFPFSAAAGQLIEVDISTALSGLEMVPGATHIGLIAYTEPTTLTDQMVGMRFAFERTAPANTATLGATNTFTGTQTAPAFVGDGSGLTNLPVPAGVAGLGPNTFTGTQTAPAFIGSGAGLTNLPIPSGVAGLTSNQFTGTQTINSGNLDLDASTSTSGNLLKDGTLFLHNRGTQNTYLGLNAGSTTLTFGAAFNTGLGYEALFNVGSGGESNTAVGNESLRSTTTGDDNVAVGAPALRANTTGLESGQDNIYIGWYGSDVNPILSENRTLRLGERQTRAFIAGVRGVDVGSGALSVVINANGQLGTVAAGAGFAAAQIPTADQEAEPVLGMSSQRCSGPDALLQPNATVALTCGVSHTLNLQQVLVIREAWIRRSGCIVTTEKPRVIMSPTQSVTGTLTNRCAMPVSASEGGLAWLILKMTAQ